MTECPECGARYTDEDDSCAARFDALLALDHSRREPWGSRHGQAFAAFALQHPEAYPASLDRVWAALHRIYIAGERALATRSSAWRDATARMSSPAKALYRLPAPVRLGLEMAAHEETERRALEGELAALEAEWRTAEEIAAIADDLLIPDRIRRRIQEARRGRLR